MADVTYSVEVQFLQSGSFSAPAAGIKDLHEKTDKWQKSLFSGAEGFASSFNSAFDTIGGKLLSLGETAVAAVGTGLAAGLGLAITQAFKFNEEMENTQLSLSAIANANGLVANMGGGMRIAADVMKQMRIDARELPGEFKDLENIMANIAGPSAQMGLGMYSQEELARKTMMAAAIAKVPQQVAAREMAMLLAGNARHNMPLFQKLPFEMDSKEFNKLKPEARLAKIREVLGKVASEENIGLAANTFTGLKTTIVDSLRQAVGAVGGPLFQTVKGYMHEFVNWTQKSKDSLQDWGVVLGDALNNAFIRGVETIQHWFPIVKAFGENVYEHLHSAFVRLEPFLHRMFAHLESFMKDPNAFGKIEKLAQALLAFRVGTGAAEHMLGLGTSALPAIGTLASGGAEGAAAIAAAAGPLAAVLALVAVGFYGMFDILTRTTSELHNFAVIMAGELTTSAQGLMTELGKLWISIQPLVDLLGGAMLFALTTAVFSLEGFAKAINFAIGAVGSFTDWVREKTGLKKDPVLNPEDDHPGVDRPAWANPSHIAMTALAEREKDRKVPTHVTNIGAVHINVNGNADPNRVAKKTTDIIQDLVNHPKIAQLSGNPNYAR